MTDETTRDERCCNDCAARAPHVETDFTLISARHGWRVRRTVEAETVTLQWRCPRCWLAYKASRLQATG